jgi:hypothetical protein
MSERADTKSRFGPARLVPSFKPGWFAAAGGLRAYSGTPEGLFAALRSKPSHEPFSEGIKMLDGSATGPIDGSIWVAPQEDVVFYASTAPGTAYTVRDEGRRLWMIRF